ncbi:MAG: phosphate regulon transcriptional regulator PhoB [Pseudomonadota bacterium]
MAKNTILIVEDDAALSEMLRFLLERNGYETMQAADTEEADRCLQKRLPDAILLDWMLPGMSGIDYARRLKSHPFSADISILMLTARGEEEDKIRGLDCGADDYITKPFSTNELLARLRAAIRRTKPQQQGGAISHGDIVIDPQNHSLKINGQPVEIGLKEFQLLYLFLRKPDRVYDRSGLLDQVWGKDSYVDERTVDVYIRRLRSILEKNDHGNLIKTIRGVGYRLAA